MTKEYPRDVEAEIFFLTIPEGGRKTPTASGYRGQFYYDGRDWDAIYEYQTSELVCPGQQVAVYIFLASPWNHVGKLFVGKEFLIREGARTVARGRITKILELENPNRLKCP